LNATRRSERVWKSARHARDWLGSLEDHVFPVIGDLPVEAIDTALVQKVLTPLWSTQPRLASVIRGRIENVLDRATVSTS
jgi:hypothetical protein